MVTKAMMRTRAARGFTLIEMIVVMAAIGLLLSIAVPRYMAAMERGREQVLEHNLRTMREALDKFYGDNGRYPDHLEDLVERRYLRAIPVDPYAERPTWIVVAPKDAGRGGVIDVRSTRTDVRGEPLPDRLAPPDPAAAPPGGLVDQEAGGSQIVTVRPALSATESGGTP